MHFWHKYHRSDAFFPPHCLISDCLPRKRCQVELNTKETYWEKCLWRIKGKKQELAERGSLDQYLGQTPEKGEKEVRTHTLVQFWENLKTDWWGVPKKMFPVRGIPHQAGMDRLKYPHHAQWLAGSRLGEVDLSIHRDSGWKCQQLFSPRYVLSAGHFHGHHICGIQFWWYHFWWYALG